MADLTAHWGAIDYAFLSPIYDSISKPGYIAAGFNGMDIQQAVAAAEFPVFALGGITLDKLQEVHALGFAGIAVIGGVWSASDPVKAFEDLHEHCLHTSH